jgi:hypothetical protein
MDINSNAFRSPARGEFRIRSARVPLRRISAIQLNLDGDSGRLGPITQLPETAQVEICGDGFNDRTVKVRWNNSLYFVFREDLEL